MKLGVGKGGDEKAWSELRICYQLVNCSVTSWSSFCISLIQLPAPRHENVSLYADIHHHVNWGGVCTCHIYKSLSLISTLLTTISLFSACQPTGVPSILLECQERF